MRTGYFALIVILILSLTGCGDETTPPPDNGDTSLKLSDFESAASCEECHPQYYVEWERSMHAYSSKDPVWYGGNASMQELLPGVVTDFCMQCHNPIGFSAGAFGDNFTDPDGSNLPAIVQEGVTCDVCHTYVGEPTAFELSTPSTRFDYEAILSPGKIKYGAFGEDELIETTAHRHGETVRLSRSSACLPCHDYYGPSSSPLEITYTEWLNSPWGAMTWDCQKCHMPTYRGKMATGDGVPDRDGLHRHDMMGVDLDLRPNAANFDIQRTMVDSILKNSVTLSIEVDTTDTETVNLTVTVYNDQVGHNIPSAVTFVRQMWVEVIAADVVTGEKLYESGTLGDQLNYRGDDTDLKTFHATMYGPDGGTDTNVFDATSIKDSTLKPFETRNLTYAMPIAAGSVSASNPCNLDVDVRLLFRSFPPQTFRDLGFTNDDITDLLTFEMETDSECIRR